MLCWLCCDALSSGMVGGGGVEKEGGKKVRNRLTRFGIG